MFCKNCGAQIPDGSVFCDNCGTGVSAEEQAPAAVQEQNAPVAEPAGKALDKKKLILFGGIAAGIVLVLVVLLIVLGSTAPQRRAKAFTAEYLKVFTTGASAKKISGFAPSKMLKIEAQDEDISVKELIEQLQEYLDGRHDRYEEDYEDYKIKFDVSVSKVKDMKKSTLEDGQEFYEDEYDLRVTKGKVVTLKITVHVNNKKKTVTDEVSVIKIGGKWYVADSFDYYEIYSTINDLISKIEE